MDDKLLFEIKSDEIVDSRTEEGREKCKGILKDLKDYVTAIPEDKKFFAIIIVDNGDKNEMNTLSNLNPLKQVMAMLQITEQLSSVSNDTYKQWQEFRKKKGLL